EYLDDPDNFVPLTGIPWKIDPKDPEDPDDDEVLEWRKNGITAGFSFPRFDPADGTTPINAHVIDSADAANDFFDEWFDMSDPDNTKWAWKPTTPKTITVLTLERYSDLDWPDIKADLEDPDYYGYTNVENLDDKFDGAQVILFQAGAANAYIEPRFDALTNARVSIEDSPEALDGLYEYAKFGGFGLRATQGDYNEAIADVFGLPEYWNAFTQDSDGSGVVFFGSSARFTSMRQWVEFITSK
ncbi:MAG: hypothetical protein LBH86_02945, partial [Oscillospiraceae bacterium]|nr:hypothetical protein [Oscillospiraceae bacterium]